MIYWREIDRAQLEPDFCDDVTELLEDSPYSWYVLEGFRSMARSNLLYAAYKAGQGPRAAPAGSSAHNFGLAIDVVLDVNPDMPGLQPSWVTTLPGWVWLKAACTSHPRLKNGWSFGDWPHIEKYKWQSYKEWQLHRAPLTLT